MLTRLVVLNSNTFGKASLRLDDADSIQLVGPNNIGKSTLIYTLNFLFIIDGKKMIFSGSRSEKDTLHHYFPNPVNSYLVFEVYKHRYYCIVLKRGTDGELEYYRLDAEYQEDFFMVSENNQHRILKFEEVKENLAGKGLTLYPFRNKSEVFNFIYQRGRDNDAAVWLEDNVVSDGISNNFSKVYKYLINSKLINNKTLKEALIIADSRDKEAISFSQKDRRDITNLLKANEEIKIFDNIQTEFFEFKELVRLYRAKEVIVSELIDAFNKQFLHAKLEYERSLVEKQQEIDKATFDLNEKLKPRQQELDRMVGSFEAEIKIRRQQIIGHQTSLDEIRSFDTSEMLQQAMLNSDEKRKKIETGLTRIDNQGLTLKQLDNRLQNLKSGIEIRKKQVANYSKLLIQNISAKQETREKINYILSDAFLSGLTKDDVSKKIVKLESVMKLFDGEIKVGKITEGRKLASVEEIKAEIQELTRELNEYKNLLPVVKNYENVKKELQEINLQIESYRNKIQRSADAPKIEKTINSIHNEIDKIDHKKEQKEKEIKLLKEEITRKEELLGNLYRTKTEIEARLKEIKEQKFELEQLGVTPKDANILEPLDVIYRKIKLFNREHDDLKVTKDKSFEKLKAKVNNTLSSEEEFISYVEEEIACLPDKRKSIEGYLQAISVQFANPASALLRRYLEFHEFIYNKFNKKLSKTRFSDIDQLKIELIRSKKVYEDLERISAIQDISGQQVLDFGHEENLKVLNEYLDGAKTIEFDQLFDVELHLNKNGKDKKVDLKEQVESDGTDRMIRLIIVMSVINRLAINEPDNKIVVFIDEIATIDGNNRRELFRFCKEHNFIPICASPDETILDGFEKYILLFRPGKGGKVIISEKHPNVILQKRLTENEVAN